MDRAQKAEQVAALKQTFSETQVVVITRNLGMTVAQSTALRNRMREVGASYKVTKNTLTLIALEGTTYASIGDMLTGPTALATSQGSGRGCQGRGGFRQDDRQVRDRRRRDGRHGPRSGGRDVRLPSFRLWISCVRPSSVSFRRPRPRSRARSTSRARCSPASLALMPPRTRPPKTPNRLTDPNCHAELVSASISQAAVRRRVGP
jgi:hypothetical protein